MYPTKKLSEICEIINGGTPDTTIPEYWYGDIFWITPKDMGQLESIYVSETSRTITESGVNNSSAKIIPVNSVILSSRAPIGHLAINTVPMCTNQGCKGLVPMGNLNHLYLYYFLLHSRELLNSLGSGTTFKELSSTKLKEVKIPLPSLDIQSRIVARLDETFASIDEQIAFIRENIEDVKRVRESVLFRFFGRNQKLLPLSSYVEKLSGIALPEIYKNGNGEGSYPFYKVGEMNNDQRIMKGATLFFNEELSQKYKIKIFPKGTIVFPKRGGAIFTEKKRILTEEASYDSNVMGLKANNRHLTDEYLFAFMKFIKLGDYADDAGIAQINNKHIDLMKIPLPPLNIQHSIVAHLDSVFATTEAMTREYEAQIVDLEILKQSLLREAFEGRLVSE